MMDPDRPPYYAKHGMVWKHPIYDRQKSTAGSEFTEIKIGFPICTMHKVVGDHAAVVVAELMNRGERCGHMYDIWHENDRKDDAADFMHRPG